MTSVEAPFDPGLQPERTLLAWRRTCLAAGVAGLVFTRFAAVDLADGAMIVGVAVLLLSAGAYVDAARRYRRAHLRLTAGMHLPGRGGPVTLAAASVALFGGGCVVWFLSIA